MFWQKCSLSLALLFFYSKECKSIFFYFPKLFSRRLQILEVGITASLWHFMILWDWETQVTTLANISNCFSKINILLLELKTTHHHRTHSHYANITDPLAVNIDYFCCLDVFAFMIPLLCVSFCILLISCQKNKQQNSVTGSKLVLLVDRPACCLEKCQSMWTIGLLSPTMT